MSAYTFFNKMLPKAKNSKKSIFIEREMKFFQDFLYPSYVNQPLIKLLKLYIEIFMKILEPILRKLLKFCLLLA